jgi:para-nitrobenzyl esterase
MDENVIPRHPFEPDASPLSADIPVMVGYTKDEMTLYNVGQDWWRDMTEDTLKERLAQSGNANADALVAAYRELHPDYAPRYLYTDVLTTRHFMGASTLAERKAAQNAAPAYLYEFAWDAPVDDGMLKAPHTIEIPFVFDNVDKGPILLGQDDSTVDLGKKMSAVWVAFARTGNPNTKHMPEWPAYDAQRRATMVFGTESKLMDDHRGAVRKLMQG